MALFFISFTEVGKLSTWCDGIGTEKCKMEYILNAETNESTLIHSASDSNSWALTSSLFDTKAGDVVELSVTTKTQDENTNIGIVGYDFDNVPHWSLASGSITPSSKFKEHKVSVIIPYNIKQFTCRFYGTENANFSFKDMRWSIINHFDVPMSELSIIENNKIQLTLSNINLNISVLDKTTNRIWKQRYIWNSFSPFNYVKTKNKISFQIKDEDLTKFTIELSDDGYTFEISRDKESTNDISNIFPMPFLPEKGDRFFVPYGEGIAIDADQKTEGGTYWAQKHLSMAFIGISNGESSMMMTFETPYDGDIFLQDYNSDFYYPVVIFKLEKGRFSYNRRIRYNFMKGSHVSICKKYRSYAKSIGLVKPLKEKKKERPNIEKLIGAVNVWLMSFYVEKDLMGVIEEMESLGMKHLLISSGGSKKLIDEINTNHSNVIIGTYDIYQDQMNPEYIELGYVNNNSAYLPGAYPDDIIRNEKNELVTSWEVDNQTCIKLGLECPRIGCTVLCDSLAPAYAAAKVSSEYEGGYHFQARFIDTSFASGYKECYHKDHPMTFRESAKHRVDLMKVFADRGLVVGSEDGKDIAVPYTDYFEGMMSPGRYRVPGSGRNLEETFFEVPNEEQTKFMLNESFRVPLFELVYHDCAVSYWYWCDHNSKVIPLWDKRDMFNRLYGTPPMFLFNKTSWSDFKDRFVQSYKEAEEVSLKTGYAEMIDHKYLTSDMTVQQTLFSNGVRVTVNFGSKAYDGIESMGSRVEEGVIDAGMAGWKIALIVIAVLAVIVGCGIVGFLVYRKKRTDKKELIFIP